MIDITSTSPTITSHISSFSPFNRNVISALVFFMQVGFAMLCAGEYISFVKYRHE